MNHELGTNLASIPRHLKNVSYQIGIDGWKEVLIRKNHPNKKLRIRFAARASAAWKAFA